MPSVSTTPVSLQGASYLAARALPTPLKRAVAPNETYGHLEQLPDVEHPPAPSKLEEQEPLGPNPSYDEERAAAGLEDAGAT